jgi:hypothetical protein
MRTLLPALCLTALATGQSVFVVDVQRRAGFHFDAIQPAVAAAAAGDVVIVRDGSYVLTAPVVVDKPLALIGKPGAHLFSHGLELTRIPAGRDVAVSGLQIATTGNTAVRAHACPGRVLIDRVRAMGGFWFSEAVVCEDVAQMTITHGEVTGSVRAVRSTVFVTDSTLNGRDAGLGHFPPMPALRAVDARIELVNGTATGGNRDNIVFFTSAPGIELANSDLRLAGDTSTRVTAGPQSLNPVSAVTGTNSRLLLDPSVTLQPALGAPAVGPGVQTTTQRLASLTAAGAPIGGAVRIDLRFAPNEAFGLVLGLPGSEAIAPGIGSVWIAPSTLAVAVLGSLSAAGTFRTVLPVPQAPALRGLVVRWQGVVTDGGGLRISNPATYVHDEH